MKPEKTNINLRRYLTVGLLSAAFCSTAARADLTAYYMLDNTTGTAATDSSGNGRNGTIGGAGVVWAPTSGMLGGAVKFDGVVSSSKTGRIGIPTTSLSTAAGTIALWARLAEPQNRAGGRNGVAYFFGFGSASGSRISMLMTSADTKLDIEIGAATKADIVTLSTATWYHLAITWNGTEYRVYVNGFEQATAAATITSLPTPAVIGNKGLDSPVYSMDGMVDEFRIYSTALSQSEIYSLTGAAGDPNPANGAGGVALNATLLWSAGIGATSHDVYFSTSNPPQFILNTTQTGYDPGPLSIGAVYYWKIDERNSIGTVTAGMVWSFSTPSAASNLNPANGAKKISVNTDLSWTAGSGAISETLYFGRTNPPALKGPVTANSYDPGTLDVAATYYWKIDTETSAGTLSSPLWSFRTEAPFYGDFNSDSVVDWMDIAMFVQQWLDNGGTADFDKSGNVDIADYAHLSNNWLASSIETGLVASLKMDEAAGLTAPDTSGNGNHGTLIGTLGAGIAWAPSGGTIDGAVNIDGSDKNARVEVPIPGMEIYSGAVSLWLRLKEPQISGGTRNGMRYIFGFKGVGETHKVQMFMSNDDTKLDVDIGKMSVTDIATLQTEKWYHLAVTWDGMIYWIYIDGQQIQSSFYGALHSVPAAASVGNDGQLNQKSFCGLIDNFRLYKRTISAKEVQTLAGLAICLSPADGSENISPQSGLNWSAGDGAGSSSVYLGTDRTSVEARDPATFKTSLQTGSFNPGTLALQTGYYWCIDENYDNAVSVKGALWSFATISSKAADPYPADGANATENSPLLSWTAGYGATSRDVYFGTVTPPPFAANLPATNYQSPITNYNTTYYWRIDEHNSGGTVTGDIWSFTTAPLPPLASNPSPENASTGVSLTVNLGWTGTAATSFDVYFGSTGSPPFVGNQTGTSFDCNILNTSTVYYWRIDPVNAAGTTTGEVWSFTTTSSTGAAPPIADFFVMPPEGWDIYYIGEFISTSTGKITDYKWEFGDGAISTELTASHKYGVAGLYTVKLTVGGPGGVNS